MNGKNGVKVKLFIILFLFKVSICAPNSGHHHGHGDHHGADGHGHHHHDEQKPEEEEIDFSELLKGLGIQVLGKDQESADDISPAEDHHQLNVEALISELFSPSTAPPPISTTSRPVTSTEKLPIKSHWEGWFLSPIDLVMHNHVLEPVFDEERSSTTQSPVYLTETQYYLSKDEHNPDKFGPPVDIPTREAKAIDLDNHLSVDKLTDKPVIPVLDTRWANYHLVNTGPRKHKHRSAAKHKSSQKGDEKTGQSLRKHSEPPLSRKSKRLRDNIGSSPGISEIDSLQLLLPPGPETSRNSNFKTLEPGVDARSDARSDARTDARIDARKRPRPNTREEDDLSQLISEIFSEEHSQQSHHQPQHSQQSHQPQHSQHRIVQNPIKTSDTAAASAAISATNRDNHGAAAGVHDNHNVFSNPNVVVGGDLKKERSGGRHRQNSRSAVSAGGAGGSHVQQQIHLNAVKQQQKQQQQQQQKRQKQQQKLIKPAPPVFGRLAKPTAAARTSERKNKFSLSHNNNSDSLRSQKSGASLARPRDHSFGKKSSLKRSRNENKSLEQSQREQIKKQRVLPASDNRNEVRKKSTNRPGAHKTTGSGSGGGAAGTKQNRFRSSSLSPTSSSSLAANRESKALSANLKGPSAAAADNSDLDTLDALHSVVDSGRMFNFGKEVKSMFKSVKSFNCAARKPGLYADVSTKCKRFIMCHENGRMGSFRCPSGTLFNQEHQICDWRKRVNCQSR